MLLYLPHGLSYIMGEGEQWKLKKLELLIQSLWAMWDAENGMQKKIKGEAWWLAIWWEPGCDLIIWDCTPFFGHGSGSVPIFLAPLEWNGVELSWVCS